MSEFRSRWLERTAGGRENVTDKTDKKGATAANSTGGQEHATDKTDKNLPRGNSVSFVGSVLTAPAENADGLRATLPPSFGRPEDWPPECLASLRLCHGPPVLVAPHAILFPLIGRRVQTPRGPGRLLQVFAALATVALDTEPERTAVFEPTEIRPEKSRA